MPESSYIFKGRSALAIAGTFLFLLINAFLIYKEFYWFMLLPFALLALVLATIAIDILFFAVVFLTPFSVNLEKLEFGLGIALPTEPLMFGIMVIFLIRTIFDNNYDVRIMRHPVTLIILLQLAWILITTVTSEMPLVSVKFFISRLWFITVFYFLALMIFRDPQRFRKFMWLYILPLTAVILYTITNHYLNGFEKEPAHWVMTPFYKDHTSYGAILALYLPILIYLLMEPYSKGVRFFIFFLLLIFIAGIILSYTRAAWVSLIGALGIYLIYRFRIRLVTLLAAGTACVLLLLAFQSEIKMKLEKNRQDSSDKLSEHIQSISNISSDASNLERINRWNSALRMFEERPVFGWGPGTYTFQYAPFQLSKDQTIISTNAADLGNAHSEYIGPLAEQGIAGSLLFVTLLIAVFLTGTRTYFTLKERSHRRGLLAALAGLTTYFIHGLLNNFLDTDKASVPFWGFIALIVAMELYYPKKESEDAHAEQRNIIPEVN